MTDLLFVNASPRGEASESLRLAEALLDAHVEASPSVQIDRLDLFEDSLAPFGRQAALAKMEVIAGREPDADLAHAWRDVQEVGERVLRARTLLFTVPMWNAGIPWALKHFVDTVTQPGLAFRFDPKTGYHGLLGGRRAVAIYTSRVYRDGVEPAFGVDFHARYFDYWLRFCGIEEIHDVRLQPTFPDPDFAQRRDEALTEARSLGRALADSRAELCS